jgi:hypothetical protein
MAYAAEPTIHPSGALAVSYDDNILAAPQYPPEGELDVGRPVQDVLIQYAPGVALNYITPRTTFGVFYSHPVIFYVKHPGADTSADIALADGKFVLSPEDVINAGFELARYSTNTTSLRSAEDTPIMAQRGGDSTLIAMAMKQDYSHGFDEYWSFIEGGDAGLSIPLDGGSSLFACSVTAGPQLAFRDHAFALLPTFTYSRPVTDEPIEDTGFAASEMVLVGGRGRWHWVFSAPEWSLSLNGGALAALEGTDTEVEPLAGAAVRYLDRGLGLSLIYDHGFVPNLITGQTYFSDTVALAGELPIVRERDILLRTSSGVAFSRAIDITRDVDTGTVNTLIGDFALGWYPELYPQIEVRYQHTRQWDAPPDQLILPNYTRNVVSLQVSYMFPPLVATFPKGHSRKPEDYKDESMKPIGE